MEINGEYDDGFFQWNLVKNKMNIQKHGISFGEASGVFDDASVLEKPDATHSWDEDRWIALGSIGGIGIVVVVWVARGEKVRLISARRATASERRSYERQERR